LACLPLSGWIVGQFKREEKGTSQISFRRGSAKIQLQERKDSGYGVILSVEVSKSNVSTVQLAQPIVRFILVPGI
jgi:hypothetical protein